MVKIIVPSSWCTFTGGVNIFELEAGTVNEAINGFIARYPTLRSRIFADNGNLAPFTAIFINDSQLIHMQELQVPLATFTTIRIIPAIVGG